MLKKNMTSGMRTTGTILSLLLSAAFPIVVCASEGGHAHVPEHIPTAVWLQFLNLGILLFLLYRVVRKPLRDYLIRRQDTIRDSIEKASETKSKAESELARCRARMAGIEQEIAAFSQDARAAVKQESEAIVRAGRTTAERLKQDVEKRFADELAKARYQLRRETIELAVELAEKMIRERMNSEEQRKLAEAYLSEITPKQHDGVQA